MRKRIRRHRRRPTIAQARSKERASGEEAIATREESESEATPSRMTRLKAFRL